MQLFDEDICEKVVSLSGISAKNLPQGLGRATNRHKKMRKYSYENERIAGLGKVVKLSAVLLFATIIVLALMLRTVFTTPLLLILLLLLIAGMSFTVVGLGLVREIKSKEEQIVALERRADEAERKLKEQKQE